ncbi:unnamed protein product [Miscanthus lutarioriparius]|uniref:Aconitase/3-isopropylmalate dehydratase large subunit alpha/beta/alpha domain-containing protein n=1 Tax=Miscanthus lutarioriparius TaxID=422564 RepID=A0A811SPL0_9POAL|nr:unnamed protein product [Miscanthus lutarioriparius]
MGMVLPGVVGFKLTGKLRSGVTATDLVLTVTQMLRKHGVVGKFVEFYGEGMGKLSLADSATIANISPEYGATWASFLWTMFLQCPRKPLSWVVSGLQEYLNQQGFHIVDCGCTTCIGNSGDLDESVSTAITENDVVAAAVLSGNRNFEGRVHPLTEANYLASPPLVVAYALAGTG